MLLDDQNRAHVWGMNSNGEMGTGDKDAQEEPILLEAIDDKTIM